MHLILAYSNYDSFKLKVDEPSSNTDAHCLLTHMSNITYILDLSDH